MNPSLRNSPGQPTLVVLRAAKPALFALLGSLLPALAADPGDEFFEKKIRPVLAEKCYACHSVRASAPMGGLRVDTAAALLKGGDSGPALMPKDPDRSLLIKAIRYTELNLKMPPTGKLPPQQIADFEEWIRMGAPDPRQEQTQAAAPKSQAIDWTEARKHWSFRPVTRPAVPQVKDAAWVRTPVDAFILARLEENGLKPAPPADKRSWLRRVTFDLTGLPPTPAEIASYLKDDSAQADKTVVERLLASPHYGERWARHWLDLVRFAETNGHEFDNDKLDAWRYRDYVIRAFNEDVPYTQFVREHIAGDLIPAKRLSKDGAHWESPIATAAFWFGEVLNSATDSVKSRADTVDNQIDVLGKTFLGLTTACARCHDHKFDPIPTIDYYGIAGMMHSTAVREAVIDSPRRARQIGSAQQKIADINARIAALREGASPAGPSRLKLREGDFVFEDFEGLDFDGWTATGQAFGAAPTNALPPNQPLEGFRGEGVANSFGAGSDRLVGSLTSRKFKMPKLWVHVRMAGTARKTSAREKADLRVTIVADDHKSEHYFPSGKPGLEWKTVRMTKEIGRTCYFEIVDRSREGHLVVDKIVISDHEKPPDFEPSEDAIRTAQTAGAAAAEIARLEQERAGAERQIPESAFAMIAKDESPHDVKLHIRGSHQNLGAEVPRHFLQLIAGQKQAAVERGSGRLELADWLASDANPLTPRVMVNRLWKHHFGQGIVRSADNFGRLGEPPTHPELIDFLAATFREQASSVKEMHRLMVLSATYRMSSIVTPEAAKLDPRNSLLHHMPVRRLEAEAIRDAILAVSGRLDKKMYGPGVTPHVSKYQEGRGKPESGPLDGDGRRSLYIQVRRNFLTPLFLAFDYPLPVSTIGSRGVSTVPSQALMMMNNEFVAAQARLWAQQGIRAESDSQRRLHLLFEQAYARLPEDWETQEALKFVATRPGAEQQAWTDLCHVLLNSTEFVYVR